MDILCQQLQKKKEDSVMLKIEILVLENQMKKERLKINEIEKQIGEDFPEPPKKRKKDGVCKDGRCQGGV
jgi:chaperonin cofactor prefoldin